MEGQGRTWDVLLASNCVVVLKYSAIQHLMCEIKQQKNMLLLFNTIHACTVLFVCAKEALTLPSNSLDDDFQLLLVALQFVANQVHHCLSQRVLGLAECLAHEPFLQARTTCYRSQRLHHPPQHTTEENLNI